MPLVDRAVRVELPARARSCAPSEPTSLRICGDSGPESMSRCSMMASRACARHFLTAEPDQFGKSAAILRTVPTRAALVRSTRITFLWK